MERKQDQSIDVGIQNYAYKKGLEWAKSHNDKPENLALLIRIFSFKASLILRKNTSVALQIGLHDGLRLLKTS